MRILAWASYEHVAAWARVIVLADRQAVLDDFGTGSSCKAAILAEPCDLHVVQHSEHDDSVDVVALYATIEPPITPHVHRATWTILLENQLWAIQKKTVQGMPKKRPHQAVLRAIFTACAAAKAAREAPTGTVAIGDLVDREKTYAARAKEHMRSAQVAIAVGQPGDAMLALGRAMGDKHVAEELRIMRESIVRPTLAWDKADG